MLEIATILDEYISAFPAEADRLKQLKDLIKNSPGDDDALVSRKNSVGHVTASGFVISRSKSKVLLVHRHEFQMYLQPGGHYRSGDGSLRDAALREIKERTSIRSLEYLPFHFNSDVPIDIDTHAVPENPALHEPRHYHHDFRYVFLCEDQDLELPLEKNGAGEYQWWDLNEMLRVQTFTKIVPKIQRTLSQEFRPKRFFDAVATHIELPERVSTIVVAHLIADVLPYLKTLGRITDVLALIPKPKSIDKDVLTTLQPQFRIEQSTREDLQQGDLISKLVASSDKRVVLFDIGGYFAPLLRALSDEYGDKICGVIEDTENGQQKYENIDALPFPVYSVARSPLKDNEDLLVGQSVLFSADVILREVGKLIQYLNCSVFGYGKIGNSIAYHLMLRGVKPSVFDIDPIRRLSAYNHLCSIPKKDDILQNSHIIFCATGNHSLGIQDFRQLKPGCLVFSVTSSDDELDLRYLESEYNVEQVAQHITKYSSFNNHFFLVNKGNAVNFIHQAVLGDFIHLVRGEMLYALKSILSDQPKAGLHELSTPLRRELCETWTRTFVDEEVRYLDISRTI